MSIKVSVVIPVYNAEKYLTDCIESLLNQTLKQCEFIFVNDGSMDDSSGIINEYKKKDNRIILINQENQGVSIARNKGLQAASGEYVGFVDADDYVQEDMFGILYDVAKQNECDVVICNYESVMNEQKVISKFPFPLDVNLEKDYIQSEIIPYFIKSDHLNAIWNKLYRNNIIKENNIIFPEKIALGEDGLFNINFFCHVTTAYYTSYYGYHYREVFGSATRNISEKDYFQKALDFYNLEIPEVNKVIANKLMVKKLKSIKLIRSVIDFVNVYFTPSRELGFWKRYQYVKKMIKNQAVRTSLPIYENEYSNGLGRYEEFILKMIKRRYTLGLYCATAYSRFRNK